jgi:divalent metal cation (Fe/Co/Zn/Cd) transporter
MSENDGNPYTTIPKDKVPAIEKAKRLEMWSLFFLFTIIVLMSLTMGASQAMKAMWIEDTLSLIPSAAVLIGFYTLRWEPDSRFPYGYHRAVQIGFLTGAVALFGFGFYMVVDAVYNLIIGYHPTIQTIEVFGQRVWLGWLMIAVLAYSVVPPLILGQKKKPLATELHDKSLYTSAAVNKGDWLSGGAGILGILGIAFGYWWADSVAAGFIAVEITRDGVYNLKNSVFQLMNMRPTDVEEKQKDPIYDKVKEEIGKLPWVSDAQVRLREDGPILAGEALVVPKDETDLIGKLADAGRRVKSLDWRLQDFNIVPVRSLEGKKAGRIGGRS